MARTLIPIALFALVLVGLLLLGPGARTAVGFVLGTLLLLSGLAMRGPTDSDSALEERLHGAPPPTDLGVARAGGVVRVCGRLITPDRASAPFSREPAAGWLAETIRIRREPHQESRWPDRAPPGAIEIDDGTGTATLALPGAQILSRHQHAFAWHWRNGPEDLRLEQVFAELHPKLEVFKGSAGHFRLREKRLQCGDPLTVFGKVVSVEAGPPPRVELGADDDAPLVISNIGADEIGQRVALGRAMARWSLPVIALGLGCLAIGVVGLFG